MGIKKEDTLKCPLCGKRYALYSFNKEADESQHGYLKIRTHIETPSFQGGCKSPEALDYIDMLQEWDAYRSELEQSLEAERTESFDPRDIRWDRVYIASNGFAYRYPDDTENLNGSL